MEMALRFDLIAALGLGTAVSRTFSFPFPSTGPEYAAAGIPSKPDGSVEG